MPFYIFSTLLKTSIITFSKKKIQVSFSARFELTYYFLIFYKSRCISTNLVQLNQKICKKKHGTKKGINTKGKRQNAKGKMQKAKRKRQNAKGKTQKAKRKTQKQKANDKRQNIKGKCLCENK